MLRGLTTMGTGWTQKYWEIILVRLVEGVWTSGVEPGTVYILSMWYRRNQSQYPLYGHD
jgi:hypothetical protein